MDEECVTLTLLRHVPAVTCDQSRALDVLVMKKGPVNHLLNVTEKNDDVY